RSEGADGDAGVRGTGLIEPCNSEFRILNSEFQASRWLTDQAIRTHRGEECFRSHRFYEVYVKPGRRRCDEISFLTVPGERDQADRPRRIDLPQLSRELESVHRRQADIEARDVSAECLQHFERLSAVEGRRHLESAEP